MPDRKALLNYTTSIDVTRTLGEIMSLLAFHHAGQIGVLYDSGLPSGIGFSLHVAERDLSFRLPANVTACHQVLRQQHQDGRLRHGGAPTREQAARVAWRILKDWVEAQVALIETGMVKTEEVFLPYLLTDGQHTLYQLMERRGYLLAPPQEHQ